MVSFLVRLVSLRCAVRRGEGREVESRERSSFAASPSPLHAVSFRSLRRRPSTRSFLGYQRLVSSHPRSSDPS